MTEPPLPPVPSTPPPPPPPRPDWAPPAPSYPPYPGGLPPRPDGYPPRPDGYPPRPDGYPPRPDEYQLGPDEYQPAYGYPPAYGAVPPPATPDSPTDPGFAVPGPADRWSEPFYATGPHQPPYPPPAAPPDAFQRGRREGLFDLHEAPASDGRDRPSRAILAVAGLIALVVLTVATIVIVWLRHDGSGPTAGATTGTSATAPVTPSGSTRSGSNAPTPTSTTPSSTLAAPPGQAAARTIDRDITRSVGARKLIGPANTHIRACTAGAGDIVSLRRAAKIRTNLVAALAGLDVRSLPGGALVVADLRTAWTYSARADRAYAAWGRAHLNCTGQARTTGDPDWDRAHANDLRSTAAKERTVKDWNPVAARYHLAARSATTI